MFFLVFDVVIFVVVTFSPNGMLEKDKNNNRGTKKKKERKIEQKGTKEKIETNEKQ